MPAAPYIQTKNEFINYIKRQLGYPVVNIEITDEQYIDNINTAVQTFIEKGYSGTQMRVYGVAVEKGKSEYKLPYDVVSVLTVYDKNQLTMSYASTDIFSMRNFMASDFRTFGFYKSDILSYEMSMQFLETLDLMFNAKITFDFNSITKNLYIFEPPAETAVLGVLVYEAVDTVEEETYIYDQKWIKAYAVELCRRQWAYNLMKYSGSILPNGLTMNAEAILSEAKENIQNLLDELEATYTLPIDFFIG